MNPKIAFNDLVEKVGESESNVNEVLSLYSYRPRSFQDTDIINNDYGMENSDFIKENIISVNQEKGDGLTYELSLFGVMLILLIVLYNDMKKLKHGLYIKKYSFKKYCDKIAHNYSHKLPLVFGKWDYLRRVLQISAIYNFDVVLLDDRLINKGSNSLSVIMEGNEEIFQGIRKILLYNNNLMQDLLNEGLEVLEGLFLGSVRSWCFREFERRYDIQENKSCVRYCRRNYDSVKSLMVSLSSFEPVHLYYSRSN